MGYNRNLRSYFSRKQMNIRFRMEPVEDQKSRLKMLILVSRIRWVITNLNQSHDKWYYLCLTLSKVYYWFYPIFSLCCCCIVFVYHDNSFIKMPIQDQFPSAFGHLPYSWQVLNKELKYNWPTLHDSKFRPCNIVLNLILSKFFVLNWISFAHYWIGLTSYDQSFLWESWAWLKRSEKELAQYTQHFKSFKEDLSEYVSSFCLKRVSILVLEIIDQLLVV